MTNRYFAVALIFFVASMTAAPFMSLASQESVNVIPGDRVFVRNNSNAYLYVHIFGDAAWKKIKLNPRDERFFNGDVVYIAIMTQLNTNHSSATPPLIEKGSISPKGTFYSPFFVLPVSGGERYEICWSTDRNYWIVQPLRAMGCN